MKVIPVADVLKQIQVSQPKTEFQITTLVYRAIISKMVECGYATPDGVKEACRLVAVDFADLAAEASSFSEVVVFTHAQRIARTGSESSEWFSENG